MIRRRATSQAGAPRGRPRRRRTREALGLREKLGWILAFLALGAGLLWVLWPVVSLLLGSAILAYLLDPLADRLERRGLSRSAAIGLLFGIGLLAVTAMALLVIPAVAGQFQELSGNLRTYLERAGAAVGPLAAWVEARTDVHIPLDLASLQAELPIWIGRLSPDARASIQGFLSGLFTSGLGFFTGLLDLLLMPLFTFYLLRDWDRITAALADLVPAGPRPRVLRLAGEIDGKLQAFVRGQITMCLILGVLFSLGYWVAGIDLAFVVGLLAGALFIVPYAGPAIGLSLALILAFLKFGLALRTLAPVAVFAVVQGLEGWVLTPKIVGDKVGLHPMVVIVALLVGGSLLGIWGMMAAIPLAATLAVLLGEGLTVYRESRVYRGS